MEPVLISTQKIKTDFSRAAPDYSTHAKVQKKIMDKAFGLAAQWFEPSGLVLDVGCGVGDFARMATGQNWQILQCDIAQGMCEAASSHAPAMVADAQTLPIPDGSLMGYFSSLTWQWLSSPRAGLQEIQRVLKPGGHAVLTTFGPATLQELKACSINVDRQSRVNEFPTAEQLKQWIDDSGLHIVYHRYKLLQEFYADFAAITQQLKGTGATNKQLDRSHGLGGRDILSRIGVGYEQLRTKAGLPVTWEAYYFVVSK